MKWLKRGACVGVPPEMFFPKGSRGGALNKARQVCAACPVIEQCQDHAILHEPAGFWGGMTQDERQNERVKRGLPFKYSEYHP